MAITYPLTLPTITGVKSITLRAVNVVGVASSPLTLSQQVVKRTGSRWESEVTIPTMTRATAGTWTTFVLKLHGQFGTFLMGSPDGATVRGSASATPGTPVVMGTTQTGTTIDVDGLPLSATGYLLEGDFIQFGTGATSSLHQVIGDVDSDGAGNGSIDIWPPARTILVDDSAMVVANAVGVFRMASNDVSWRVDDRGLYSLTFAATEAI